MDLASVWHRRHWADADDFHAGTARLVGDAVARPLVRPPNPPDAGRAPLSALPTQPRPRRRTFPLHARCRFAPPVPHRGRTLVSWPHQHSRVCDPRRRDWPSGGGVLGRGVPLGPAGRDGCGGSPRRCDGRALRLGRAAGTLRHPPAAAAPATPGRPDPRGSTSTPCLRTSPSDCRGSPLPNRVPSRASHPPMVASDVRSMAGSFLYHRWRVAEPDM